MGRYASATRPGVVGVLAQLAVALSPVVLLTTAFALAGSRIAGERVGQIPLTELIVAAAVFTPVLSQTISAPVFAALDHVDYSDRFAVAAAVLREIPRGIAIAVPVSLVVGTALAVHRGWDLATGSALVVVIALHLVLAIAMVVGFATKRPVNLLVAWLAYGVALVAAPQLWWLPPIAGAASQLGLVLADARRASPAVGRAAAPPSWSTLGRRLGTGFADALPLWSIPPMIWLLAGSAGAAGASPTTAVAAPIEPGIVFTALVPALIGYQVFFIAVAGPLWDRTGRIRHSLGALPYPVARKQILKVSKRAVRAALGVIGVNVACAVVAVLLWWALRLPEPTLFALLAAASSAACCTIALSYQYSIISSRALVNRSAWWLGAVIVACLALGVGRDAYLVIYALAAVLSSVLLLIANRSAWRHPEYALFWRKALSL